MTDAAYGIEEIDKVFGQNVMETAFGVQYNTYSGFREMLIYHDTFRTGRTVFSLNGYRDMFSITGRINLTNLPRRFCCQIKRKI